VRDKQDSKMGVFSEDAGTASSLSPLKSDDTAIGHERVRGN